jgi:MinD-like ATPase involved in chromosome partitioning or flagellar assembly
MPGAARVQILLGRCSDDTRARPGPRSKPGFPFPRGRYDSCLGSDRVQFIGIHSYRGGAGKTTLAANLGFLAARAGARVALVDGDLQAPALHLALGVESSRILHSVSEFLQGRCELSEVPIDLSRELGIEEPGSLHLLPASSDLQTTSSIFFDGYDGARLPEHLRALADSLQLELLILDTHLGFNRETLLSLATSDTVLVLLRQDGQDEHGTSLLVQIAKKVGLPSCLLVPSMLLAPDVPTLEATLEQDLGAPVAGVLPWCQEVLELGCKGLFAARHGDHVFTKQLVRISERLMPAAATARSVA